ncbi:hypothetical protein [Ornithinimicrobium flavum]|uniref:hypothetical protein n=1 Tax=Ornithinimicrobium flavum TaxID=1288636 RepID=UPI0010701683|nr:hypothetical protein [Ornithinimicrobium flavum]
MTRTRVLPTTLALALCLGLAACGTKDAEPADPTGTTTAAPAAPTSDAPTPDEDDMTSSGPTLPGPDAGDLPISPVPDSVVQRDDVQQAVADEAERRGVPVEEVTVAGYAEVTWRDGSLGCPQPGMMYTQALVPGHQLVLEVDGEYASYHAGRTGAFTYCADPVTPAEGSVPSSDT